MDDERLKMRIEFVDLISKVKRIELGLENIIELDSTIQRIKYLENILLNK